MDLSTARQSITQTGEPMQIKISKDVKETIDREVGRYLASVSYDRTSRHPKAIISVPDGRTRSVFFSNDPGYYDLRNIRSEVRSTLRELGAIEREEMRRRPRLGELGAKLLETAAPVELPFPDPEPRRVLTLEPKKEPEPMTNVTPLKTATPEPAEKAKEREFTRLTQSEIVQITRLLLANATIDETTRTFTFNEGWSDQRIFEILRSAPNREDLKVSHVTGLRRRDFGETVDEKAKKEAANPEAMPINTRLSALEIRLDRLERELGLKS